MLDSPYSQLAQKAPQIIDELFGNSASVKKTDAFWNRNKGKPKKEDFVWKEQEPNTPNYAVIIGSISLVIAILTLIKK